MPAQVLLQVIWDKKRSRATSQKIPPFPSSGASWMRADISVALLSWGTSQTVIRRLSPVSSVRQGIWRTTLLETLPKEQIIAYEGSEAYCLVPRDQKATLTVQAFLSNESNHYQGEPGEILYESQDGRPVVLIGNVSDIIPNLLVTLTGADGEKMEYHPALSLCDGTVARPVSPNVYDFSRYQAEDSPISADFLGQWESEDGGVVFSSDGTMSLWSGSSMDQATDQKSGTFYVISNSTQYPAGAVLFELTDDHDTPAFWGIFTLAVDGATLTATHVSGDLLWGKETVLFTQ
ncbi:MAG: hypothetical protein ACLT9P_05860 [Evtepia gabavorous]